MFDRLEQTIHLLASRKDSFDETNRTAPFPTAYRFWANEVYPILASVYLPGVFARCACAIS
jgi:hypothetical protein